MSRPLTVWLYVDEYASWSANDQAEAFNEEHPDRPPKTGQDVEYEELEALFREALPAADLRFHRGKRPHELANAAPAFYAYDIGGLCYRDHSGRERGDFCRQVAAQVADHPDTHFLPHSAFTLRYARGATEDLLGEHAFEGGKFPPNLFMLPEGKVFECERAAVVDWVRRGAAR